jgi:hypothetical protein
LSGCREVANGVAGFRSCGGFARSLAREKAETWLALKADFFDFGIRGADFVYF